MKLIGILGVMTGMLCAGGGAFFVGDGHAALAADSAKSGFELRDGDRIVL